MHFKIDCGHGYDTAGKRTVDGSMREWQFNSKVGEYVVDELKTYENVTVERCDDVTGKTDVPLAKRVANSSKATALISIHANASGSGNWDSASGIETWIYNSPSAKSIELAANVQNHMIRDTSRKNRGVKKGNLYINRESSCPSILVEGGFMSNKEEAELLKSDSYRRKIASAIVKGIVQTFGLKEESKTQNKGNSVDEKGSVEMLRIVYKGSDGVNIRNSASFDKKAVIGVAKFGEAFTIKKKVNDDFYQLASGLFIATNTKYIQVFKK